jgi:hypothetical protein
MDCRTHGGIRLVEEEFVAKLGHGTADAIVLHFSLVPLPGADLPWCVKGIHDDDVESPK